MGSSIESKALVLNIQRMSTEDGPGIRTTVFFKGCSLSCAWCHNPESIACYKEIQWVETRCIGCKSCIKLCPNSALNEEKEGIRIDRDRCKRCLKCANECPALAIEVKGEEWELNSLVKEVVKDKSYFEKSCGGVTVSGGEPLVQYEFVSKFFKELKGKGIHTALDTSGMCSIKALEDVLPYTDLVLFDIKLMDPVLHRKYTGKINEDILKNLLKVAEMIKNNKMPRELWIRTPIIPEITDCYENIKKIGEFIAGNIGDVISRWDLCAFNNLCRDKYIRLNVEWAFKDSDLLSKDEMENIAEYARKTGVDPDIVHWSGVTRVNG